MNAKQYPLPAGWEVTYEEYDSTDGRTIKNLSVQLILCDEEDFGPQVAELKEVAIRGRAVFVADADDYFEGDESRNCESEILEDPTWLDIFKVLPRQIEATREECSISLQGVRPAYYLDRKNVQRTIWNGWVDVPVYELILWS